jgi:hypothetical protein
MNSRWPRKWFLRSARGCCAWPTGFSPVKSFGGQQPRREQICYGARARMHAWRWKNACPTAPIAAAFMPPPRRPILTRHKSAVNFSVSGARTRWLRFPRVRTFSWALRSRSFAMKAVGAGAGATHERSLERKWRQFYARTSSKS